MKNIILDLDLEDICIIKINRPDTLNALNKDVLLELNEALNFVKNKDNIRILIITGEGERSFCSGGDLKYVVDISPVEAEEFATNIHNILNKIENLDKPVIAAINGYALGGGCQLALACDFRIASSNAILGQPEVKLGILPGWGGTQRLPRVIGIAKAKELIYTGKTITAYEAKQIGLVNQVVEFDNQERGEEISGDSNNLKILNAKLIREAICIANQISNNSYDAIKISKSLINKGMDVNIETGLQLEIYGNALSYAYSDRLMMMTYFLKKK